MTGLPSKSASNPEGREGEVPCQLGAQVTDPVLAVLREAIVSGALPPSEAMTLSSNHLRISRPHHADDATATRAIALADAAHGD